MPAGAPKRGGPTGAYLYDIEVCVVLGAIAVLIADAACLGLWILAVCSRRANPQAPASAPHGSAPRYQEALGILVFGLVCAAPGNSIPLVWTSPAGVPKDLILMAASTAIISFPVLGWGLVKLGLAIRNAGGKLDRWARAALLAAPAYTIAQVLAMVVRGVR